MCIDFVGERAFESSWCCAVLGGCYNGAVEGAFGK